MQKTKDNIGKEIGDETAMQMDANLFVGDLEGIKKSKIESRKIASSAGGAHYLYVQGLSQKNNPANEEEIEILEPSEFKISNRTGGYFVKKEILSDDQEDNDADEEDIYQEEILKVIQSEAGIKQTRDELNFLQKINATLFEE